jgi:hypothetical protein
VAEWKFAEEGFVRRRFETRVAHAPTFDDQ